MKDELITLEFDGGSRGNPGPAGIGVVLRAQDGTPLVTLGRFIGRATNNVAEYNALITALEQAKALGARRIQIRGDSELIVRQIRGEYRVKHPDLKPLYEESMDLLRTFDSYTIDHNFRHKNQLADRLANLAMDRKGDVTEADEADQGTVDAPTPAAPKKGDRHVCPRCRCSITIKSPTTVRAHQLRPFTCQCGMKMDQE
jgi:ribonuclease HI